MVDKMIRDGKVAVLYSPGFGAGWSTWSHGDEEFYVFDAGLVALAERKAPLVDVEAYLKEKFGDDRYLCLGGWEDVEIEWLDQGARFVIEEYDGSESLRVVDDLRYTA